MPVRVDGFSQIHVSGTGGGQKYGNILVQPFMAGRELEGVSHPQQRAGEEITLGRYAARFESGIAVDVTTAHRAALYRLSYPESSSEGEAAGGCVCRPALLVDCGWYLGLSDTPDGREAQMLVGSQVEIVNDTTIAGYSRVRGGWNNGRAYTVYFCATASRRFVEVRTFRGREIGEDTSRADHGDGVGALVAFPTDSREVTLRVGLSFVSELKARENLREVEGRSFEQVHRALIAEWDALLGRVEAGADTPAREKRMFYTALYHSLLMPTDRTGENPLWFDKGVPYYDDFYAIWDTYRTSSPLLLLIDPQRQADIINSLVNIWHREGYMPDARSGNANGRTQGGSNAEIVIADAFVKGLEGVDYATALKAMLADAEQDPGSRHEAEGRGGVREYNSLGYVPYGIPRAGNRTVEYSLCDFAIAQVARGVGCDSLAAKYERRSHNWRNLWRGDYEHDGARGFIWPRDAQGKWLDTIPFGHAEPHILRPTFVYTPTMFEGPWYMPWWDTFFYEASGWEYSLSMPHDVDALIEVCGGREAFERRLDTFFDHGYFNVNNEPSFLSPCLYHWVGREERTADRVLQLIADHYSDRPDGLPGNDDAGATSSWLAFNMAGLYPNAAHPYYLIHTPVLGKTTFHLANGRDFTISAPSLSAENRYVLSATLNGKPYSTSRLAHEDLMAGGELVLEMGPGVGTDCQNVGTHHGASATNHGASATNLPNDTVEYLFTYKLHGQTRRFKMGFVKDTDGGVTLHWSIVRNLKLWRGSYRMSPEALQNATELSWLMPEDGHMADLPDSELFNLVSRRVFGEIRQSRGGNVAIGGIDFRVAGEADGVYHLVADNADHTEMWVSTDNAEGLPVVVGMAGNPHEINWKAEKIAPDSQKAGN